jgi:tRNA threonylcarbamoyladenosine biosynthesis protein TsaE
VEETRELGRRIGAAAGPGTVLSLVGDLGAGKTQFVKGLAVGAGLDDPDVVTSPTFVLMNSYPGRAPIRHYDLYRIDGRELPSLGFTDFRDDSVIVIEWGEKAPDLGDHLRVTFEVTGETTRRIEFDARGPASLALLQKVNLHP